jgi:hypothetical protein
MTDRMGAGALGVVFGDIGNTFLIRGGSGLTLACARSRDRRSP